jgi:hypothetical protein
MKFFDISKNIKGRVGWQNYLQECNAPHVCTVATPLR